MSGHDFSPIYNTNVRVDGILVEGSQVTLTTSRSTYFDSLLTNRSMDYPCDDGRSVRDVYEPGPFLTPLSESRLSNHLGFNGFVELSDGNIVLVVRRSNLSIGKNALGSSVAASMKSKYALDDDRNLTRGGIAKAIQKEVVDELRIELGESTDYLGVDSRVLP